MQVVVETTGGKLRGDERRGVLRFRGVPYAQPPVGALRFRPPEPAPPWAGVREATEVGPSAPQGAALPGPVGRWLGSGPGTSEDCLTLNLWTPGLDDARRPVMVWIHGGAFVLGSGAMPLYSGRRLALRGDVVVVTINYRLGALGFLQLDLVNGSREGATNPGVRDQLAALRWVHENAAAFGGDPGNVTIFGESAGAMSVGTLLGVPEARPLFHRAILQSGAAHNVSRTGRGVRATELFLRQVGLSASSSPAMLGSLSLEQVLGAQMAVTRELGIGHGTLPWQPTVDRTLIPRQTLEAAAAGETAGIPMLIGTNRDEWKLFTMLDRGSRGMDGEGLRRRFERVLPGKDAEGVAWAERAAEVYGAERSGGALAAWEAFNADRIFRYPAARLAELHAGHEARTFQYLFQWRPGLAPERVGACHALEIPFVFGTLRHPLVRPVLRASGANRELSRGMQEAWLSFARGGEPESTHLPAWPRYEAGRREVLVLGRSSKVVAGPFERERAFWDPHLSSPTT